MKKTQKAFFFLFFFSVSVFYCSSVCAGWDWEKLTQQFQKTSQTFPRVEGKNLENQKLSFPSDFRGELTIVFLGFSRSHQTPIKTWIPFLKKTLTQYRSLDFMTLPVMGSFAKLFRFFIEKGMKKATKEKRARQRLVPFYFPASVVTQPLKITDTKEITVLLLDKKGRVFWKTAGAFTEGKGSRLLNFLKKHQTDKE